MGTLAAAGPALLALTLAACSSGAPTPPIAHLAVSSGIPSTSADPLHLAGQCLREHGLPNVPDPVIARNGPAAGKGILDKTALKDDQDTVVQQAIAACAVAIAQANIETSQGSSDLSTQEIQARLALARCIRAHGVPNFPDPNPTTGEVTPPPGLSKTSPSILAAIKACPSQAQAAGLRPGES
jgi:hypothetical protein